MEQRPAFCYTKICSEVNTQTFILYFYFLSFNLWWYYFHKNNFTWYFIFRYKNPLTREVPGAWSLVFNFVLFFFLHHIMLICFALDSILFIVWLTILEAFCKLGRLKYSFFILISNTRLTSYHTSDLEFRHLSVACSLLYLFFQSLWGSFHSVKKISLSREKSISDDNHSLIRVSPEIHLMYKRHSFWLLDWYSLLLFII